MCRGDYWQQRCAHCYQNLISQRQRLRLREILCSPCEARWLAQKRGLAHIFISNCFASPDATVSGFLGRPRGRISRRCLVAFAMRSRKRESPSV
jgi:hypothetical protein